MHTIVQKRNLKMTRLEHLLSLVGEECAEVIQRVSKAARFGLTEIQPGQDLTNLQRILVEYADVCAAVKMLLDEETSLDYETTVNGVAFHQLIDKKIKKVEKYLTYSEQCGTLSEYQKEK